MPNAQLRFRIAAVATVAAFAGALMLLSRFLTWVETSRPGVVLPDPILSLFQPVDLSIVTFGVIYVGFVVYLVAHRSHPRILVMVLQGYTLMLLFRIVALYLVPLDPPVTTIPLTDHLIETFGPAQVLTKDLFFSGHTSIMALLALSSRTRGLQIFFALAAVVVAACVLLQHVHYTADVFVAPFFAYAAYGIVRQANLS